MNISIKNISDGDWRLLKSEAARHNLKIAEFLNKMLREHKKKEEEQSNVHEILYGKKILDEKDAIKIKEVMSEFRKELEFR
ncbi:hypothetical protein HYV81_00540 [Candidatus Woesearchaeota archaeon]|nr:hypothetical protein [Candidatus Woesearchaeota archaeon]